MRLISWNIARRPEAWRQLLDSGADVALLQEAAEPPGDVAARIEVDDAPWYTAGADAPRAWRTAVVLLTKAVSVEWLKPRVISEAAPGDLAVSRLGTLAAAHVTASDGTRVTVASMYGLWERPLASTGSGWIYADASAHRVISDLAAKIGSERGHRILIDVT